MNILPFPAHGSPQYIEYLLAQRFTALQHIRLIDEVLKEWKIALTDDDGRVSWHRTTQKGDSDGKVG